VTRSPPPSTGSAPASPPWAVATACTIDNPRPLPAGEARRSLVSRRKGSHRRSTASGGTSKPLLATVRMTSDPIVATATSTFALWRGYFLAFEGPPAEGSAKAKVRESGVTPLFGVLVAASCAVALLGVSGVFGQLQDALNTIWGVKPKPGRSLVSFLRARFLSFAMVAGMCFLLLVSLTTSAVITAVGGYLEHLLPGGSVLAWTIHLVLDISIVTLLFAMIFKFLPDARLSWRDVRLGAALTTALFLVGKYALGLYLGSGAPGSAYGAAGSLITMLIWVYYAAQIVLFGAEFTRVYAQERGRGIRPAKHAVRVDRKEIELPTFARSGDK